MNIRHARREELDAIMEIYAAARTFMHSQGNRQWGDDYPSRGLVEAQIAGGEQYVCEENGAIACVFSMAKGPEEIYRTLKTGAWLNEAPYYTVHRVASTHITRGAAAYSLNWAFEHCGNIRMDTFGDNAPMQGLLRRCGFTFCGTFEDEGKTWLAFQRCQNS